MFLFVNKKVFIFTLENMLTNNDNIYKGVIQMLGEKLKEYRKRKGWNQEDLAKYSGYSRSSIINWETGKRAPRTVDIEKLAQILGISTYDLLDEKPATQYENEPIRLQTIREQDKAGYAYWGGVLDKAQRVAKDKDMQEISIILPILKLAYETLISVLDTKHEVEETSLPNLSAYNGDHSSYMGNSLTVGAIV